MPYSFFLVYSPKVFLSSVKKAEREPMGGSSKMIYCLRWLYVVKSDV